MIKNNAVPESEKGSEGKEEMGARESQSAGPMTERGDGTRSPSERVVTTHGVMSREDAKEWDHQ